MNIFTRLKDYLLLREAVRKADNAYEKTGNRYYVTGSIDGKLVVMDRKNFRKLKQKGYISRDARISDLIIQSFYFTPYALGNGRMSEDMRKKTIKSYYKWRDDFRKAEKMKRKARKEAKKNGKKGKA